MNLTALIGALLWGLEAALGRFEPVVVRHRVPLGYFQTKQSSALGFQLAAGRIAEVGPNAYLGHVFKPRRPNPPLRPRLAPRGQVRRLSPSRRTLRRPALCFEDRTWPARLGMSEKDRRRHSITSSARAIKVGNGHAECIRGLEVDKKLEFRGLLYRKVARFCTLEDFGDVLGRKPKEVGDICAIPH